MLRLLVTFRNSSPQLILIIDFWKQELKMNFFQKAKGKAQGVQVLAAHASQPWLGSLEPMKKSQGGRGRVRGAAL